MRTLYFDCFSGISGDMVLGALIDCGIDPERFIEELKKLNIDGYSINIKKSIKNGISGTDVDVILEDGHDDHHHHHRNLKEIEEIIDKSLISQNAKDISKKIFRNLAEAEAKIHGKAIDEIHFHEVGAIDSIIDIVGTAVCIDMLGIESFMSSPVNTGMGFVECQHGIIPVPGPAAVELLKGVPVYSKDIMTELVTPTGAAILKTLCESFGTIPNMVIDCAGYGCGKKNLEIPNLLRVIIGDQKKNKEDIFMIECNIDDMNNEFYQHVMDELFSGGALDVFLTNIIMKKGRPAVKLSVLSKEANVQKLCSIIFKETTTIGIRKYKVEREVLERKVVDVKTKYGSVKVKVAYIDGKIANYSPEYETIKRIAKDLGIPIKLAYNEALKEFLDSNTLFLDKNI